VDEKQRTIGVTDEGWETIEKLLGIGNIADAENWELKHYVETAIKAHALYKRDVEYVVKDGEVIIVDTFTGRLMPGRRWSDGLHQSIEAKEGVNIRKEDQTLATITFQNYFRLYKKLSGMTGTAETEAAEFEKIYKLEIVVIPTNKPMLRLENPDVVYRTEKEKYKAVADDIASCTRRSSRCWWARRRLRRASGCRDSCSARACARGAERQVPRARGGDCGAGRAAGDGDHLDQHGRPRHGYSAGRQSRSSWRARSW
jgi:preprotein translocase subunit SecA